MGLEPVCRTHGGRPLPFLCDRSRWLERAAHRSVRLVAMRFLALYRAIIGFHLRLRNARACCRRGAAPATDRSRGSCPIAGNAVERQQDRARMLPSELPNPACAGARQVQWRGGLKLVSERRRGSCRELVSGLQKVRLVSAELSAIREFLS